MNSKMISNLRTALAVCALTIAASAYPAAAQEQKVAVTVPFAFENGSQHLPAGSYVFTVESGHMISFRGAGRGGFAMTYPIDSPQLSQRGKVVFRHSGDRYYLGEIWIGGSTTASRRVKSRMEKHVEVAQLGMTPTNVEVAANEQPR